MSPVRGVVRKIDHLGRIVIPVEIRRVFGIVPGDELDISLSSDGEGVSVVKVQSSCVICKGTDSLVEYQGKLVCSICRKGLASTLPVSS
ncbi:MAG TPA: AbrB/MazE/SpoVT family DNA-binding domain-containing protein [Acidimicrobiales bacterium]|nr:AbrB/MazE/SpoVT family DNA-binding domain-containing protein [Acidimicrobiales bacterium]